MKYKYIILIILLILIFSYSLYYLIDNKLINIESFQNKELDHNSNYKLDKNIIFNIINQN